MGADLEALSLPTLGNTPSPRTVTAPASFSLNLDGDLDLGGFVFKDGTPFIHNDGGASYGNTAVGLYALVSATPGSPSGESGSRNSAFGSKALHNNTTGSRNTATGDRALYSNTTGIRNTASGDRALYSNTTGFQNTASGFRPLLFNTSGHDNIAIGSSALLFNTTGIRNTAIGYGAGYHWTTGDNNIALGSGAFGAAGESGVIRIGGGNNQTQTFIEGISGTTVSGVEVMITADDQLGVAASSARFKRDILDLEGVSDRLLDLRPVSFRYKDQPDGFSAEAARNPLEYGLIAEEVAEIFPELVVYDEDGKPYTVRYHLLTPLLLGEMQRQEGELAGLRGLDSELAELRRQMADRDRDYRQTIADLKQRLDRLVKKKRL